VLESSPASVSLPCESPLSPVEASAAGCGSNGGGLQASVASKTSELRRGRGRNMVGHSTMQMPTYS
jgi:hypothetical protein